MKSRAWIGKAIVGIGAIHSAFGLVVFHAEYVRWFREGLWNTVNGQPYREFPFWFLAFGILTIIFGAFVDSVERKSENLPPFLGWSLLVFTIVVVFIMPISGGWLLLAPALGAIWQSKAAK